MSPGVAHGTRRPRYHLTPKGKEYQRSLEAVAAVREGICPANTSTNPKLTVLWNGLLAGILAGSILLATPVLWFGTVDHGSLEGIPWFLAIEVLSPLMLGGYAMAVVFIVGRERNAFGSLFHMLDQKTEENTLLMQKLIATGGDGQRFRDLLEGVTTFLKDGSVDFDTRKRLFSTLTGSRGLEGPLMDSMKEHDGPEPAGRGGSPPLTSPVREGQA
jgi:hypothetical protein